MTSTDKITFMGGMDLDTSNDFLPKNKYKRAYNFILARTGELGVIVSAKGNELVTYSLPAGGNKVVGSFDYVLGSANFYFVWNSNDDHLILRYDYAKNAISTVAKGSFLGFLQDVVISEIQVANLSDDSIIYWTDGEGEPRKMPIQAGIRYYDPQETVFRGLYTGAGINKGEVLFLPNGSGTFPMRDLYYMSTVDNNTTTPWTSSTNAYPAAGWELMKQEYMFIPYVQEDNIYQLAPPPTKEPLVKFVDNVSFKTNRLRDVMWQFRYKFVYGDGQESAWSPISKVPLPNSALSPLGTGYVEEWKDNQIEVGAEIPNNAYIRSVKLAAREVRDSKAPSDFFLYKEVFLNDLNASWGEVGDGYGLNDRFTNTEDRVAIDVVDSAQLFYWIPRKSRTITLTSDNRLVHGNCVFGYDVDVDNINQNPPTIIDEYGDATLVAEDDLDTPNIPSPQTDASEYTFNFFDVGEVAGTINAGDVFTVAFSGETKVSIGSPPTASVYPDGFPTDNGIKEFAFSAKYTVSQVDFNTLTQPNLKIKIANDIAKLIRANETKEFYYDNFFSNPKAYPITGFQFLVFANNSSSVVRLVVRSFNKTIVSPFAYYFTDTRVLAANVQYLKSEQTTEKSFKRGSTQTFAIAYSDKLGRISTAITSDAFKKDIQWYSGTSPVGNGKVSLSMQIRHEAPDWANKCHILKKIDNGISRFIQIPMSKGNLNEDGTLNGQTKGYYFVKGIVSDDGTEVVANDSNTETVNIYLNALNGSGNTAYNNLVEKSILSYSFTKGDRLRFISNKDQTIYYEEDVEIIGYNESYNYITINRNALEIDAGNPNLLSTLLSSGNQQLQATSEGALFEIYSPSNEDDLRGYYYETGITLDVVDGLHVGTDGETQDFATGVPAYVDLDCGDVYFKNRWYSGNVNNWGTISAQADGEVYLVEDYNYSDVFTSNAHDVGRFNLRTAVESSTDSNDRSGVIAEMVKPNIMFYSQPFAQGTNLNRLGTIYDTSFKEVDNTFNSIQKLYSIGDIIHIFQEDRVGMAYNSRYVASSLGTGKTITSGATAPVISDIQYYDYRGGISLNPESHVQSDNYEYFFDSRRGNVCMLAPNGITEISMKGVDSYVKDVSKTMLSGASKDYCLSAFDKRNKEALFNFSWSVTNQFVLASEGEVTITIPSDVNMSQFVIGQTLTFYQFVLDLETGKLGRFEITAVISFIDGNTIYLISLSSTPNGEDYNLDMYKSELLAYSEMMGAWSSFRTYQPDFLSSAGVTLISWRDGQLYLHDSDTALPLSFYGEQHDAEIEVVSSLGDPTNVKRPLSLSIHSNEEYVVDGVYDWETTEDGIQTDTGQVSDLQTTDFVYKEGNLFSNFLRDKNTPNVTYSLLDGEYLKGSWTSVRLKLNGGFLKTKRVAAIAIRQVISYFAQ